MADGEHPRRLLPGEGDRDRDFKVDESYPDEAILEVALLPKDSTKVKPQVFFIGLKKTGSGAWLVNYWVPRAAPRSQPPATSSERGRPAVVAALPAAR